MFARKSLEGTHCQVCGKQAVIDVYFYGDNFEAAIKVGLANTHDPDIRLCKDDLQELYRVLLPIVKEGAY